MFEALQADQDWTGRLFPNRPLSSYTVEEKRVVLDRHDAMRAAGRDENSVLAELDVSRDIIRKWRLELATKSEANTQTHHQTGDTNENKTYEAIQADQVWVEKPRPSRPSSSYTIDERKAILDRYDALIREGKSMSAAVSEVGVKIKIIGKWRAQLSGKTNSSIISKEAPAEETSPASDTSTIIEDSRAVESPQSPATHGQRRYVRHVARQYSLEEKERLLDEVDRFIAYGVVEQIALDRLGLTNDMVNKWREEFEATKRQSQELENKRQIKPDINVPPTKRKTPEERKATITEYLALIRSGKPKAEVATLLGHSGSTIENWIALGYGPPELKQSKAKSKTQQRLEVAAKSAEKRRQQKHEELESKLAKYQSLRNTGVKSLEAAAMVGISYCRVRQLLRSGKFPELERNISKGPSGDQDVTNQPNSKNLPSQAEFNLSIDKKDESHLDGDQQAAIAGPETKSEVEANSELQKPEEKQQFEKPLPENEPAAKKKEYLTEEEREELVAKYLSLVKSGKKTEEAARLLGKNYKTIRKWISKKKGLALELQKKEKLQRHKELKSKLSEFLSLRRAGTKCHDAASQVGLSQPYISVLIRSGRFPDLEWSPRKIFSAEERKSIIDQFDKLMKEGYTADGASKKIGIKPPVIYKWRQKYGYKSKAKRSCDARQSTKNISNTSNKEEPLEGRRKKRYSRDQKTAIVNHFVSLVKEGIRREVAWKRSCGELGVPYHMLLKWCDKYASGENIGEYNRYSALKKKQILKEYLSLRESGVNVKDAAKEVGVPYYTIVRWEKGKGITPAPKHPATRPATRSAAAKVKKTKAKNPKVTKEKTQPTPPPSKPVEQKGADAGGNLSIVLTNGNRIEGLTFEQIVELVKVT